MALKTYLVGLTLIVKHLCRYYIRYQAKITEHIDASALTAGQKATVLAFLVSIQNACNILEFLTGY